MKYKYAVVIEKAIGNYSAYGPDLPGCVATGDTVGEVEAEIREAIAFHLEGLREDGLPVPPPASRVGYVEVLAKSETSVGQEPAVPRCLASTEASPVAESPRP